MKLKEGRGTKGMEGKPEERSGAEERKLYGGRGSGTREGGME